MGGNYGATGTPDNFHLTLSDGRGTFAGTAVALGTFAIAEAAGGGANDCGLCIEVWIWPGGGPDAIFFLATEGTLDLTSISGSLTGTATDLTLREIDGDTGSQIPGGCVLQAASFSFDGAYD